MGNFLPGVGGVGGWGGGGKLFAQKILASCPDFYETGEKKRGPYDATTWAVLAYEGGSIL